MKKKHFLFTSLTIAAILSANVAQAEELTGPVTDPSQELVDNENQDSSPQPHQEGDLAINTRSASPTEEPAFPLGDPNQPGVEVTIDRQLNQTAVREEALTAMRELREEMWDLNPWFDGKKLQDAVKAAGFQGKADYAQAFEWDNELEAYAVQRSVEVSYVWAHNRPDGSDALDTAPEKVHGENLSMGYPTVTAAIKQSWGYGELDALNATQGFLSKQGQKVNGHLHNQLNPRFKSFGVGASEKHYAQSLSFSASEQTDGLKFDGKHTIKLKVTEELAKHEDFVIKTPKNEEPKKEELKPEGPKNDGTNKDELKKNENGNKPTPKNILIITEQAGVPKVADVISYTTEVVSRFASGDASVQLPSLVLEEVEQPIVVTQMLTNIETGDKTTVSRLVEIGRTNVDFGAVDLVLGSYQSEFNFTDLESNPLPLDKGSLEKLSKIPVISVKPKEFVEPILTRVTVNKTTVKKGETLHYFLEFDASGIESNVSIPVSPTHSTGYIVSNGLASNNIIEVEVTYTPTQAGKTGIKFGSFINGSEVMNYIHPQTEQIVGTVSEKNQAKLAELLPEVTVLDEDYTPVSLVKLYVLRADGSQEELPALPNTDTEKVVEVNVGDTLVHDLVLNEDLPNAHLNLWFQSIGEPHYSVSTGRQSIGKTFNMALPITNHYYGSLNFSYAYFEEVDGGNIVTLYENNWNNGYQGYRFRVNNPMPTPRFELLKPLRDQNYLGEVYELSAALDANTDARQVASINLYSSTTYEHMQLWPRIIEYQPVFDHDGNSVQPEKLYTYDASGYETVQEGFVLRNGSFVFRGKDLSAGTVVFDKATLRYRDGVEVPIDGFEGFTRVISDEKELRGNFFLSKENKGTTPSINAYYSSLGRVPEELKNRPLTIQKILLHDKEGQVINSPNAEWIIASYNLGEGSDVYYYLPFSGQLTKLDLTERLVPYGSDWLVPIKETQGVYIIAAPANKEIVDTTNKTKILSGETDDVTVRVTNGDINVVSRITTHKVEDDQVLNKLPNGIHAEDIDLFDIKTLDKDGNFVQINDEAIVTLPVVPGRKVVNVIYFLPQTGAIEELPYEWSQEFNQVVFKVSHFSNYGVVYEGESDKQAEPPAPQGQEDNQQPPAPQGQEDNQQPPAPQGQEDNQQPPAPQGQEDNQQPPAPQGQEDNQQPPAPQGQEDNQQPPAPQGQENNQQPPAPQTQTGMDIEAIKNGDYSSIQGVWNKVNDEQGQPEFIRITDNGFFSAPELNFKAVKLGEVKEVPNRYKWGRMVVASSAGYPTDWLGYHNSEGSGATYIPKGGAYSLWDANLGKSVEKIATEDIIISRGLGYEAVYTRARSVDHFYGVTAGDYGMGILGDQKGNSLLDNLPVFISGRVGDTIDLNTVTKHFRSEGDKIYRVTLSNRKDSMTLPDYQSSFILTEQLQQYDSISIAYETPFVLKDKEQKQPHSPAPQGQGNGKQTLAPQADLSTRRNQLLLELDKSPLTDEQKGQLAEKFAFANTEKELADVTAEFKRLTAALGQDSKPQTPQAPQKADAKATLPATGEAKPAVLATIGAGLLLASLGLVYHRKRSE